MTSDFFDSIRIAPRKKRGLEGTKEAREEMKARAEAKPCSWDGCANIGKHRAPGLTNANGGLNGKDTTYRWFCDKHIREFNANYDFFQGMTAAEVAKFQREGLTGHRPTWGLGVNAAPAIVRALIKTAKGQARPSATVLPFSAKTLRQTKIRHPADPASSHYSDRLCAQWTLRKPPP